MFPVNSRHGGSEPGQIRDNSGRLPWRLWLDFSLSPLFAVATVVAAGQTKIGPRSRADVEAERRALRERTQREIDEIASEFHAKLARKDAKSIGVIYARYSTQFQDSIAAQVRAMFEDAVKRGIFVPREFVFFDLAVKGYKQHRFGFEQARQVLTSKRASVLLLLATNRLFRKAYVILQFVEQMVKEFGVRCIFVTQGVDSDDKQRYQMLLHMHGMMDEFAVSMYRANIHAAHADLFHKLMVFGTITFGYRGEPIPGGQLTRRGRPQCRLVIDEANSKIVQRIFEWYVAGVQMDEIARRLNDDPEVALPPKCTSGTWTHKAVRGLLANTRYRGWWKYGEDETVFIPSKDYARQFERPEPLQSGQFEELRIVSNELWYRAQERLLKEKPNGGRKPKDGDRKKRPLLLNGLFWCPEHDRPLYVSGSNGQAMSCPMCNRTSREKRPLCTTLNRVLALKVTCDAIARLIVADDDLVQQVIAACRQRIESGQQPDAAREQALRRKESELTKAIEFNMRTAGGDELDEKERQQMLERLRNERRTVRAELGVLEAAANRPVEIPTEAEVRQLFADLAPILEEAGSGEHPERASRAREIISQITGGRIDLYQMGERLPKRGWLQGRFTVKLLDFAVGRLVGINIDSTADAKTVTVDYRREHTFAAHAERVMELYDSGMFLEEVATAMHYSLGYVRRLLDYHFESSSQPKPDGRKRRATLPRKQTRESLYREKSEAAMALWNEGKPYLAIARDLKCSDFTARKAVEHAHGVRGLVVPTARQRRQQVLERVKVLYDAGLQYQEIASTLGYTVGGVRGMLKDWAKSHCEQLPDGRTRRHQIDRKDAG